VLQWDGLSCFLKRTVCHFSHNPPMNANTFAVMVFKTHGKRIKKSSFLRKQESIAFRPQ